MPLFPALLRTPLYPYTRSRDTTLPPGPGFMQGVYVSSKSLFSGLQKHATGSGALPDKQSRSYAKYHLRACTRCTPFATFAGLTLIDTGGDRSELTVAPPQTHRVHIRLDQDVIARLIRRILAVPALARQLCYTTNNSLYAVAGGYRYAEYQLVNGVRKYELAKLTATPYLSAVIDAARQPARFPDLLQLLREQADASEEEAAEYLQQLVDAQVLVSELEPRITGSDALSQLIEKLQRLPAAAALTDRLCGLQEWLEVTDPSLTHLQQIDALVAGLLEAEDLPDNTLQADLFLSMKSASISRPVTEALLKQAGELTVLSRTVDKTDLDAFKEKFYQRYEDRLMPLALVLDADLGIGYGGVTDELSAVTPLIDGLPGGRAAGHTGAQNALASLALRKYSAWRQDEVPFISISEEDLKPFAENKKAHRLSNSMYLIGSLHKKEGRLDEDAFSFDLSGIGGPSAANLLGRFAYGDDAIRDLARELLLQEEANDPDVLFAEISHQPQARVGNILMRPVLRTYEIPYVGQSGAAAENQIPLDDLWVKVTGDGVVLWSRRHNRRVMPRLTTAHNYSHQSLPVYKFLCDLQTEGLSFPALWDWGVLESLPHLPRVTYKNIIVRKARWIVAIKDLGVLSKDAREEGEAVHRWQQAAGIPDRVVYAEGDNELLLDFSTPMGRELFLHYLRKRTQIRLVEFLFTEENAVVHDEQGAPFTNELILPFSRLEPALRPAAPPAFSGNIQRSFLPGSEWMYYKIYSGSKTAETLLKEHFGPFVEQGLAAGWFDQFFFIRYRDESGAHIRLRFLAPDLEQRQQLGHLFFECIRPLTDQGLIQKVVCDTYVRELERYGGTFLLAAEQLFFNDSLCVLRFLPLLEGDEAERYRMLLALRGIDALLDDFRLTLAQKQDFLSGIQQSFFQEFGGQLALQQTLNSRYRLHQKDLFAHMDASRDAENGIDDAVALFEARSRANEGVVDTILADAPRDRWIDWLGSYVHLFMNRMFVAQQRKYELVLYHFLEKYYSSRLAIQKKGAAPASR